MGVSGPKTTLIVLLINTVIHVVSSFSTTEPSAIHEVKVIAPSPVQLPCDVDISLCPSQLHSIKVYKNGFRVYVYVRHNDTDSEMDEPEGDFLAQAKSRDVTRAKLNLDVDPPVIMVSETYLGDEGIYRCDVTYLQVHESCRTAAYTKLITLSKPTQLEVKFDGGIAENTSRIGSFVDGTKLTLSCEASGARPPAQITWWNKSTRLGAEPEDEGQLTASTIEVELTRRDLHSRFICQAMNEALQAPMVTWVDVDVHVRPLKVQFLPLDEPIVEEEKVSLICEAVGARPAAAIGWFNGTKELSSQDIKQIEIEEDGKHGTVTTRSTYSFTATKHSNGVEMRCTGLNLVMENKDEDPLETSVRLDVYYAPRVSIQPDGILKTNSSSSVELVCIYDANPRNLSKIIWLKDNVEIDLNNENYLQTFNEIESDESEDDGDDDENGDDDLHPVLFIRNVSYFDKGTYSCLLTNDVGPGESITVVELDVYYPPMSEIELLPNLVHEHEDDNVTLECNVIAANPSEIYAYRWMKDGQINGESANNTFVLVDVDRDEVGNYSCMALNLFGWGPESENEELMVQYLPGPSSISYAPYLVVKNGRLTMKCNTKEMGHPPATEYIWYRDDILIKTKSQRVTFEAVTTQMLSNFTCAAVNPVGTGFFGHQTFDVLVPPHFIRALPQTTGVLADESLVNLTCQVECAPQCAIHWLKNGVHITDKDVRYNITTRHVGANVEAFVFDSVISNLLWNMDAWPDKRLTRGKDNAFYSCLTSENVAGGSVTSTTYFRVEYPPEDIDVSPYEVNVTENHIPPEIHCSASGFPEPTYIWTTLSENGTKNVVSGNQTLRLNFPILRNQSGEYLCEASNKYGTINETAFIDVLYEPECEVTKDIEQHGLFIIECSILSANPRDFVYEWLFEDGNITEHVKNEGNRLTFKEIGGNYYVYGNYTCTVSNSIGNATCSKIITSEGSWLEKVAKSKDILMWAAVIAALLLVVALVVLFFLCRRKSATEGKKLSMESRQNPEGTQTDISQIMHPPAVSFKKREPTNRLTRVKYTKNDGSTPADAKKKKASLPRDDKAFYENLPFHGLQPPPNKTSKPTPAPRKLNVIPVKQKPVYENMAFFPKLLVQPMFKKTCSPDLNSTNVTNCPTPPTPVSNDGIIYADLQLTNGNKRQIIRRDTPTEYAVLNFNGKNDSSEA